MTVLTAQDLLTRKVKMPGPVAAAFYRDRADVTAIMGPVGSGKTSVASVFRPLAIAAEQAPSPRDGVRRTRGYIIRDTYRNLEGSVIETWRQWMPASIGGWSEGPPASHLVKMDLPDGTSIEMEVNFLGIGEARIEDLLRGKEMTWIFLNEADLLSPAILDHCIQRVGRYPPAIDGGATWSGVWCDFNAPEFDNYVVEFFDTKRRPGVTFYRQPSGLAPNAENLANLPGGRAYYERIARLNPDHYVRRMVRNEYGFSRAGKPVFPEFSDALHMAQVEIPATQGLACRLAGDAGRTPGILLLQEQANGRLFVLDELEIEGGARQLGKAINLWLARDWPDVEVTHGMGDPAGNSKSDTEEVTFWQAVSEECGIRWRPAPTNLRGPREEAVRNLFDSNIGGEPAILISPRCKRLRQGLNYGYYYKKVSGSTAGHYEEIPAKTEWSHIVEALEYGALDAGGHRSAAERRARLRGGPRQVRAISSDSPAGEWDRGRGARPAVAEF